jgi:hypothetical protein
MTFLSHSDSNTFREIGTAMFRRSLSTFLKHFEQLKNAGERLPGIGAVSAYPSLEPSIRGPAEVKEKANRVPRRW